MERIRIYEDNEKTGEARIGDSIDTYEYEYTGGNKYIDRLLMTAPVKLQEAPSPHDVLHSIESNLEAIPNVRVEKDEYTPKEENE